MLVPDVEGAGLPLTELLPYTKIETKEIKKKDTTKSTRRRQEETEGGGKGKPKDRRGARGVWGGGRRG